jgi:hypothetical protein
MQTMREESDAILLLTPPIIRNGVRHAGALTSQLAYVASAFSEQGYRVIQHDGFSSGDVFSGPRNYKKLVAVYIYLARTEIVEQQSLRLLADQIEQLRRLVLGPAQVIYFFGPLANPVKELLRSQHKIHIPPVEDRLTLVPDPVLATKNIVWQRDVVQEGQNIARVATIRASSGCNKHCSFCAYNLDKDSWEPRPISEVVTEIEARFKSDNISRFAFSDSNFAPTKGVLLERLGDMSKRLQAYGLAGRIRFALNVTHDCFDHEVVLSMAEVGVDRCLIGLEALAPNTSANIYGKVPVREGFGNVVEYAKVNGVIPVLSLILFHPWLVIEQLKTECELIQKFGRHHFVHFMGNSFARLVQGTKLYERAANDGLIQENATPNFRFKDSSVARVFQDLQNILTERLNSKLDIKDRAKLKMDEWKLLMDLLK